MASFRIFRRLTELLDVLISDPEDGDRLIYDEAEGKWVNASASAGTTALVDLTDVTGTPPATGEAPVWDGDSFELTDVLTAAEAAAGYQPLDSDLTAVAALSTTPFGRGLLELANAAALLSAAGAAAASHAHAGEDITSGTVADARIASTIARDSEVTSAIAALSTVYQPLDSDLTAVAALSTTAYGRSFLALADAAAARALVDLEPGTDIPSLTTFNDHSARHEEGGADVLAITAGIVDSGAADDGQILTADGAGGATWEDAPTGGVVAAEDVTIADAGNDFTATDVEGALAELQADAEADATALSDHIADATAAHAASAISASSATLSGTGTDVQAVLEELDNLLDDHSARHENGGADEISIAGLDGTPTALQTHLDDASDAHAGSAITNTPAGTVAATTVQGAINELDSEKTTAAAALTAAQTEIADQKRAMVIVVGTPSDAVAVGDGAGYAAVPALLNGHNLVAVAARVFSSSASGGPILIQVHNVTQAADMLSTRINIDDGELKSTDASTQPVIDPGNDDVATLDLLRIDVDDAGDGAADGLIVILTFEAP